MNQPYRQNDRPPVEPIGVQVAQQTCACSHMRAQHAGGAGACYATIDEGEKRGERCGCQTFYAEKSGAPAELAVGPVSDDPRTEWVECVKSIGVVMSRLDRLAARQGVARSSLLLQMAIPPTVTIYPKEDPTVRPATQLRAIIQFCRGAFVNDGAEGESVHALCDSVQKHLEQIANAQKWNEHLEAELADARMEGPTASTYEEKRVRCEGMLTRLYAFYLDWQNSHPTDKTGAADWDTFKDWIDDNKQG